MAVRLFFFHGKIEAKEWGNGGPGRCEIPTLVHMKKCDQKRSTDATAGKQKRRKAVVTFLRMLGGRRNSNLENRASECGGGRCFSL